MKQSGKSEYPIKWQNILTAPLKEGAIQVYLEALNASLIERYVPSPIFVQSLLYFTLYPPDTPARSPRPLDLLYKILSQHDTSHLTFRNVLPTYPVSGSSDGHPKWFMWESIDRGSVRAVWTTMRRCENQGIWALLWDAKGSGKSDEGRTQRSTRGKRKIDDEEEEEEERKKVSERGWELLEWLVALWEKDQALHPDLGHSSAFLAQLPKRRDMQYDDASLPLAIIESAIHHPSSSDINNRQRLRTASGLLHLLVNTASSPTPPAFHSTTLTLSLLPLFRTPLPTLNTVLTIFRPLPQTAYSHFLVHAIEDLAGVRLAKTASRRTLTGSSDFDTITKGPFPPPTPRYTLELLHLPLASGYRDAMAVLQLALVAYMTQLHPDQSAWVMTKDNAWREKVKESMKGSQHVDAMRTAIFIVFEQML